MLPRDVYLIQHRVHRTVYTVSDGYKVAAFAKKTHARAVSTVLQTLSSHRDERQKCNIRPSILEVIRRPEVLKVTRVRLEDFLGRYSHRVVLFCDDSVLPCNPSPESIEDGNLETDRDRDIEKDVARDEDEMDPPLEKGGDHEIMSLSFPALIDLIDSGRQVDWEDIRRGMEETYRWS